jgi:hypothetical protein
MVPPFPCGPLIAVANSSRTTSHSPFIVALGMPLSNHASYPPPFVDAGFAVFPGGCGPDARRVMAGIAMPMYSYRFFTACVQFKNSKFKTLRICRDHRSVPAIVPLVVSVDFS